MNINQGRFSLGTVLATAGLALVLFTLLSPAKVHAEPIAITGGSYTLVNPFRNEPRFISWRSDLQGNNFSTAAGEGDGISQPLGSNCAFPCIAGSTFAISAPRRIGRLEPTSLLEVDGQRYFGFLGGVGLPGFTTGSVTIPLDAGSELTLTTFFTMRGSILFEEYDVARGGFTGFTFAAEIFGSGLADISLYFNPQRQLYDVASVRYTFQPDPVPEPATLLLLATGLTGIAAKRLKRRRARREA